MVWKGLRLVCAGGLLLQTTVTTTGCNQVLADAAAGLTSSIVNQFIRNIVNEALGLGSTGINF